jgi:predicted branched-subunit amino acid permease
MAVSTTYLPTPRTATERTSERRAGIVAMAPLLLAFAPFALALGAAVAALGAPGGWAATGLIYAGSAHLAVLDLLGAHAGLPLVVLTGAAINLRLLIFSASIAPDWQGEPLRRKAVAALLLVDPLWIVASERRARPGDAAARRVHYLSAGWLLWLSWWTMVTAGMVLGHTLGTNAVLAMAAPLCLTGISVPHARSRAGLAAVVTAAFVAVATANLPSGTGLLLAIVAGALAGASTERSAR